MPEALAFGETRIVLGSAPATGKPALRIEVTPRGAHLARALAEVEPEIEGAFFVVPYDRNLDGRLCDLIDALIAARYAHPELLQLRLALFPLEAP